MLVLAVAVFIALFLSRKGAEAFESQTTIRADFRTITGLREGSPVQLAGARIGRVSSIDFVEATYACVPLTEDTGRHGEGRTDDCDDTLFCAPNKQCADLERHSGDGQYTGCLDSTSCAADEVCYTSAFRRRSTRVVWSGPQNVCVRFHTSHRRVRVQMEVASDAVELIRRDSLAMVASNSVLGDQLVSISPGGGEPLGDDLRVLARPSLSEDIANWVARLDRVTERVDDSMEAITEVFLELDDPRMIGAIKGTIEHLEAITEEIATQRGLVGAIVGSKEYSEQLGQTISNLRSSAQGFDALVGTVNRIVGTTNRNLDPMLEDLEATSRSLRVLLQDLRSPDNHSLVSALVFDTDGTIGEDFVAVMDNLENLSDSVASVIRSVEREKGTVGKLIGDPKLGSDVGKLLHNLEKSKTLKSLLLWYLDQQDVGIKASRKSAPPAK